MPTRCLILWHAFPVSILFILSVPSSQYFLSHGESDTDAPFRFEHSTGRLWLKTCIGNLTYRISPLFLKKGIHIYTFIYTCVYVCVYENIYKHMVLFISIENYMYTCKDLYLSKYAFIYTQIHIYIYFKVVNFFHGIIFLTNQLIYLHI